MRCYQLVLVAGVVSDVTRFRYLNRSPNGCSVGGTIRSIKKMSTLELQIVSDDEQLSTETKSEVIKGYSSVSQRVSDLIAEAESILTKDTTSDAVAVEARTCRIGLMRVRTETERIRKELLRPIDLHKKAISGAAAIITDAVSRRERQMDEIETAYEARKEAARAALHQERYNEIKAIVGGEKFPELDVTDFASKSKSEFTEMLAFYAKQVSDRVKIRAEEFRLAAEARLAEEARLEQIRAEEEARRAELARQAAEEAEKRKAMEAENAALRHQLEEANKAKEAAEAKIRAEEDAKKKAAAEALAVQRSLQEQKLREDQEKAAAERKAKLAPDRVKIIQFSEDVERYIMNYQVELATKEGQQLLSTARNTLRIYTKSVNQMADKLA